MLYGETHGREQLEQIKFKFTGKQFFHQCIHLTVLIKSFNKICISDPGDCILWILCEICVDFGFVDLAVKKDKRLLKGDI